MNGIKRRILTDIQTYYRGILLAAAYLGVMSLSGIPLCPLVLLTGLPCPGCGMTRAALLFLKGRWRQAFEMHPFFYVLLALAISVFLSRYVFGRAIPKMRWILCILLVSAILFYVYRMMRYFPDRPPLVYFPRNLAAALRTMVAHSAWI